MSHLIEGQDLGIVVCTHSGVLGKIKLTAGQIFNCKSGNFHHDDIISKEWGALISARTNAVHPIMVLKPTPALISESLVRRTQIIFPHDAALILDLLKVAPGQKLVESGTGSGALTVALSAAVGSNGCVHTFEFHAGRAQEATTDFQEWGDPYTNIQVACRDVCQEGFPADLTDQTDGLFLDLPAPHLCINYEGDQASPLKALKKHGRLCTFSPCIEQVIKTKEALADQDFFRIQTFEMLRKPWIIKDFKGGAMWKPGPIRPHTSYITVATKR